MGSTELAQAMAQKIQRKQKKKLQLLVKPLHSAFHDPKMRVYAAKLKKIKEEKLKKKGKS